MCVKNVCQNTYIHDIYFPEYDDQWIGFRKLRVLDLLELVSYKWCSFPWETINNNVCL